MSQWIARNLEGFVMKHCSAVFGVSEGILNDLRKKYKFKDSVVGFLVSEEWNFYSD